MHSLSAQNGTYKAYMLNQLMCMFLQHEVSVRTNKSDSCHQGNVSSKILNENEKRLRLFMVNDSP